MRSAAWHPRLQVSVILTRDRAVVINMAFVKTIITTDACYVVSPDDERALKFTAELQHRLQEPLRICKAAARMAVAAAGGGDTAGHNGLSGVAAGWAAFAQQALELPFELRVLEICLDEVRMVIVIMSCVCVCARIWLFYDFARHVLRITAACCQQVSAWFWVGRLP
jgi:hypothetical protein